MTTDSRSNHIALLTGSRAALTRHVLSTSSDRQLIAALDAAIVTISERPLPWRITLYLAHITYSHGICTMAAPNYKVLTAEIARFCRAQWDQISDDRDPATIDDPTTVREYFQRHPEDRLHTCMIPVHPDTTTDVNALEIERHLTLASNHLSWETTLKIDEWLELEPQDRPVTIADTHYGWFIGTNVVRHANCPSLPDDLLAVLRFAHDQGCSHVLLDRDGSPVEGLPVFDW